MRSLSEKQALKQVTERLAELLGLPFAEIRIDLSPHFGSTRHQVDARIDACGFSFLIEWRSSATAAMISLAIRNLREIVEESPDKPIPVVAVPYMGEVGRQLCAQAGVCWLDLSGNAQLEAENLRIIVEGKPNRFKRKGRPRSLFAPKSSRITRYFLQHPDQAVSQRELAQATDMDEGFTSRIVRGLEALELISRDDAGRVRLADYERLLDAWYEAYDFSSHEILRGHIPARSGDELLARLAEKLEQCRLEYAATGLSGAWLLDHFAGYRLVTVFVADWPSQNALEDLRFRNEQRGENVWLVLPNDEGVFQGASKREGIWCAHPVQVYVDLKAHPERSDQAGERLRQKLLSGAYHAE